MKKTILAFTIMSIFLATGFYIVNQEPIFNPYPGSTMVFKKYYPENETLGMANDKSWRVINISSDPVEKITGWHETAFSKESMIENRSDSKCVRKTWQGKDKKTTKVTVCDHGSYRTILHVIL